MALTFGSVCSGIEAASVALHPLGWETAWLAEIEPFPSAVLAHHYPDTPNLGDMTALPAKVLRREIVAPDVLIGGTPCQSFSVAGMRKGMADERGLLTIRFVELADAIDHVRAADGTDPGIVWWENVPGVLSDKENAFGCFLAALVGESEPLVAPGGKWADTGAVYGPRRTLAWRVLDAQYFGLAQRRRRVFVVASARNGFDSCAVLFELGGVRRDTAPSREARQTAPTIPARSTAGGGLGTDFDCDGGLIAGKQWPAEVCSTLDTAFGAKQGLEDQHVNAGCPMFVPVAFDTTHTLRGEGFDAGEDGTGRGTPIIPIQNATRGKNQNGLGVGGDVMYTLDQGSQHGVALTPTLRAMNHGDSHANAGGQVAIAFHHNAQAAQLPGPNTDTSASASASLTCSQQAAVAQAMLVRRLTPQECEKLQGFEPGYTRVPWRKKPAVDCPDGPRYKAIGNSMAVPCIQWIGRRIQQHLEET